MPSNSCSIPSCVRPAKTRTWCHAHYMRWYTTGDVQADVPLRRHVRGAAAQFAAYVDRDGPLPVERPELGRCWTWTARRTSAGYGYLSAEGREVVAHRWAYEHFVAAVPVDYDIDHLCRNPSCVNYERHLEPVTHQVNMLRGENPPARFARRTACSKGHEYTPDNMFIRPDKSRGCRICDRARSHQNYLRRKARKIS